MLHTKLHFDDGEMTAVESVQDVEPILEHNKMLRSMEQRSDCFRHVAEIPAIILTKWLNEEWTKGNLNLKAFGPEMDALVEKKLKDPDWAYLRTDSAHVQGFMGFGS